MKCRNRAIRRSRPMRGGFTLMEVMLVLVIIAAIAGIAVLNIGTIRGDAFKKTAKADISNLKNMLSQYEMMVGTYPSALEALYSQPSDVDASKWVKIARDPIKPDPWQHPYEYKLNGSDYELRSLGPDGQSGTDDDIIASQL
jgi:general secretion pathway protein G